MQTQTPPTPPIQPTLTLDDYRALLAWTLSDDTGRSSKTIVARITGNLPRDLWNTHPLDLGDFGRCYRLIQKVPSVRPLLPLMRDVSPVWAALVDHWTAIETAYVAYSEMVVSVEKQARAQWSHVTIEDVTNQTATAAAYQEWAKARQCELTIAQRAALRALSVALHEGDPIERSGEEMDREWAVQDSPEYQAQMAKWRAQDERRQRKREELEDELEDELAVWDDDDDEKE